jgi:hypothetical protein
VPNCNRSLNHPVLFLAPLLALASPSHAGISPARGAPASDGCYYTTVVNTALLPGQPGYSTTYRTGCARVGPDGFLDFVDNNGIWHDDVGRIDYVIRNNAWYYWNGSTWVLDRTLDDLPPPPIEVPAPSEAPRTTSPELSTPLGSRSATTPSGAQGTAAAYYLGKCRQDFRDSSDLNNDGVPVICQPGAAIPDLNWDLNKNKIPDWQDRAVEQRRLDDIAAQKKRDADRREQEAQEKKRRGY